MTELMAKSVKKLTNSYIGIGTSAGIGKEDIVIATENSVIIASSDVYADLEKSKSD